MKLDTVLEIYGGGKGSGCDPEVARQEGNRCGRPPGSGTGGSEPASEKPHIRVETRQQHTIQEIEKALGAEPTMSRNGEADYEPSKGESYSVTGVDMALKILGTGAAIAGQIAMYVLLDRFILGPALGAVAKGGASVWKWARMRKALGATKQLSMAFAAEPDLDKYAVIVWRPGMKHLKSGKKGVGWRDQDIPAEMVKAVELYRRGEKKPYRVIKNEVKK